MNKVRTVRVSFDLHITGPDGFGGMFNAIEDAKTLTEVALETVGVKILPHRNVQVEILDTSPSSVEYIVPSELPMSVAWEPHLAFCAMAKGR